VVSIYERLGEQRGIRAAVDDFYERVLADPELASYFDGIDMGRLRAHQTKLLVQVTGGPVEYDGRELAVAHDGLDVTPGAFDRVVGHLVSTLTDLGVQDRDIAAVGQALTANRANIVTAEDPAA
jgi:hemoglobin